jgi:hypothetical protein
MTALLLIATGPRYWQYIVPLIDSAKKFFVPHDVLLFTDSPGRYNSTSVYLTPQGYPETTLKRYHTFLDHRDLWASYEHVFYVDIDAVFVDHVGPEIFSDGITATRHHNQKDNLLENRKESFAYLAKADQYYCGGFNGGRTPAYLEMAYSIAASVDKDEQKKITACWHDESHLNKYLSDYPPAKVLSSDYCYPEPELYKPCNPKIVCLDKSLRDGIGHNPALQ